MTITYITYNVGQIEAGADAGRGEDDGEEEGRLREEAEVLRAELAEQGTYVYIFIYIYIYM